MSDVPPNDDGQNKPARGELLAASTIVRFYTFADRCMDWARTTRRSGPRALRGLKTPAARPSDDPTSSTLFREHLLGRLTEHPCSVSDDAIT